MLDGVGGQRYTPATLPAGKCSSSYCTGVWVGFGIGLDRWRKSLAPSGLRNPNRPRAQRDLLLFMPTYYQRRCGGYGIASHWYLNPLNAELNPICHLLALLGVHRIFHISGLRVNLLVTNVSLVTVFTVNNVRCLTRALRGLLPHSKCTQSRGLTTPSQNINILKLPENPN